MRKLKEKAMGLIGGKEVLAFAIFDSSMVSALMGAALSFFNTEVLFLSAAAVGTIFLVARIWDAVNDPIMGIIVDRTHSKWGKCIPYLRYAPIPLLIVSIFLFLPIMSLPLMTKTLRAGIFCVLYYTVFKAVDIPMQSLQPLLFVDQQERNKAVSVSSTLGSTGTILPGGLYFALVLLVGGSEKSPMGNFIVAALLVGIGCACMIVSSRFLKEKITVRNRGGYLRRHEAGQQNQRGGGIGACDVYAGLCALRLRGHAGDPRGGRQHRAGISAGAQHDLYLNDAFHNGRVCASICPDAIL